MPTLSGLRRRGFTPEAIRAFCAQIGASRTNGVTDIEMLEHFQRDDLNRRARRAMAVLHPLKLVIDNYPRTKTNSSRSPTILKTRRPGRARCHSARELFIEQDDFREVPPPKYYRLSPGKEVRLRNAYFVTAKSVVKDAPTAISSKCTVLMIREPRRQLARRPQGEVHHALGLGRARHLRRNSALRQALHQGRSLRCPGGRDVL